MKFILVIKPTILTGYGTTRNAKEHVTGILTFSSFGNAYTQQYRGDIKYVYGYNIEVYKRGKHRKNKHFVVYRYTFPIEMFKLLNVEIRQGSRTFKIVPKRK